MRRLLAARRELSIRGRITEFCEIWLKIKKTSFLRFSGVVKDRIGMGASFRIEWDSRHRNRRDLNNPQNEKIFANDILPQ